MTLVLACRSTTNSTPRIVLERATPTSWRVTYVLDRATEFLRFQRAADFYREKVWTVVTPGWSLERDGDEQVLIAQPGRATQRLVVEFPVYAEHIPKEYELFASFSDKSVAIYTGHFYVTMAPAGEEEAPFLRTLELVPPPGTQGVVRGRRFEARRIWKDPETDGTYVYFGSIEPIETKDMIAIIDPGAPAWLVARMHQSLPAMFALYTDKFDEPLPWKPVVLFSFDTTEVPGRNSGGGTLTGLVQMSAQGDGWNVETPESTEQALYLIAHEAAHFWNGQLHPYRDAADSWMHEGSADALASLLLLRHGAIDDARLVDRRNKALNACALGLMDGALATSARRGQFQNCYTCGEIIAVWSAAALPGNHGPDGLFDLWRTLFALSNSQDGHYDRETYFEALAALGVDGARIDTLRQFIDREHADPTEALIDLMAEVGLRLERPERPPLDERRTWSAAILKHLMAQACGGHFSFRTEPELLRAFAVDGCEPFSREMGIVAMEGHPLHADGDLAFRDASKRCARGEPVTLQLDDGTAVQIPCAALPPAIPAPLAFSK